MRVCAVAVFVFACRSDPPMRVIVAPTPPVEVAFDLQAHGGGGGGGGLTADHGSLPSSGLQLDQPAHIKVRLGHYSDPKRGIGLVIDRTDDNYELRDSIARVRFDSETRIWYGYPQAGARGRIDYLGEHGSVLLHVWEEGRVVLYVPEPATGRGMVELELVRDGDAYPLPRARTDASGPTK
jgi:hypothetical protein